jgi:hypothetical protein
VAFSQGDRAGRLLDYTQSKMREIEDQTAPPCKTRVRSPNVFSIKWIWRRQSRLRRWQR